MPFERKSRHGTAGKRGSKRDAGVAKTKKRCLAATNTEEYEGNAKDISKEETDGEKENRETEDNVKEEESRAMKTIDRLRDLSRFRYKREEERKEPAGTKRSRRDEPNAHGRGEREGECSPKSEKDIRGKQCQSNHLQKHGSSQGESLERDGEIKEIELGKQERNENADRAEEGKVMITSNVNDEEEEEDWDSLMFSDTHMTSSTSGIPSSGTSTKVEKPLVQGEISVPSPLLSPPTSLNSSPGEDTDHRSSSPYASMKDRQHPSPSSPKIEERGREPQRKVKLFSSPEEVTEHAERREDRRKERREMTFRKAQNLLKCSRRRREAPPFLLVHGVFGAGKSSMLAATLASLCRYVKQVVLRSSSCTKFFLSISFVGYSLHVCDG